MARIRITAAGIPDDAVVTERSADMRLFGQLHEINIPLPDGEITDAQSIAAYALLMFVERARSDAPSPTYEG